MVPDCHSRIEQIAAEFHAEYERRAGEFNYTTRPESAVPWADVPAENKRLMMAVVGRLISRSVIGVGSAVEQTQQQMVSLKVDGDNAD